MGSNGKNRVSQLPSENWTEACCCRVENIEVITESQLYGDRVQQRRRTRQIVDPESVIRSLAEALHRRPRGP